jgi:hypothetical protein
LSNVIEGERMAGGQERASGRKSQEPRGLWRRKGMVDVVKDLRSVGGEDVDGNVKCFTADSEIDVEMRRFVVWAVDVS